MDDLVRVKWQSKLQHLSHFFKARSGCLHVIMYILPFIMTHFNTFIKTTILMIQMPQKSSWWVFPWFCHKVFMALVGLLVGSFKSPHVHLKTSTDTHTHSRVYIYIYNIYIYNNKKLMKCFIWTSFRESNNLKKVTRQVTEASVSDLENHAALAQPAIASGNRHMAMEDLGFIATCKGTWISRSFCKHKSCGFSRQSWTSTWHLPGKPTVTVPWCSSRLHQGDALCSAPKMVNTSCDEKNAKRQGCWPTIPFSWQKNYFLATSQFFYLISQPKLFLLPVLKDSITSHYFHFGASRSLVYGSFWIITMPRLSTFFFPLLLDCHEPWDLSGLVKLNTQKDPAILDTCFLTQKGRYSGYLGR